MHFTSAARRRLVAFTLSLAAAGVLLAGCTSLDNQFFGDRKPAPTPEAQTGGAPEQMTATQPETAAQPQAAPEAGSDTASTADNAAPPAESSPAETAAPAEASAAPPPPAPPPVGDLGIQLAAIQPAASTGTAVGQTVDHIRSDLSALHDKVAGQMQQYQSLRSAAAQDVTGYQDAKSRIIVRLQEGTTKGNPELVGQWNTSQSALDSLTGNVNALAAIANDLSGTQGSISAQRDAIAGALNGMGATDEDHRQLLQLRDESTGLGDATDQLNRMVTRSVRRETAFIANERDSLARMQDAIKAGELYPVADMEAPSAGASSAVGEAGDAILTISFSQAHVEFQKELYDALNKALQTKPSASFRVVALSPKRGAAQRTAQGHAREVMKSMTDMGVPASRVAVASATDPSVSASEVRVYVQ